MESWGESLTLVGLGQHTTVANGSIGREESNMRSNYKEVDKATSIILTTSEKGDAYRIRSVRGSSGTTTATWGASLTSTRYKRYST